MREACCKRSEQIDGDAGGRRDAHHARRVFLGALRQPAKLAGPTRHLFGGRQESSALRSQLGAELATKE